MTERKTLVLLSGGLDSATLLYYAKAHSADVEAVHYYYGQRNWLQERTSSGAIARAAGVPLITEHLPIDATSAALTVTSTKVVPEGPNDAVNIAINYVPMRNAIFLSHAFALAAEVGATHVGFAAHAGFTGAYFPDTSPEFVAAFKRMVRIAMPEPKVQLWTPFLRMNRTGIVSAAMQLKVPTDLTWSCYNNGPVPCGRCGACIDRAKGYA